jgi:catechol 2,3-dioxygenase-like lactoylglutathione lyase family enzyme
VHANAFDHVALWVDDRGGLAGFLCDVCGMHEIERTEAFTLVGGDARRGKLTLFDADAPRMRGVLERVVLRVPDLDDCVERARAAGFSAQANGNIAIDAPANLAIGLVQPAGCNLVDLDHVVLRVPEPALTAAVLGGLGFDERDGRLEVGDRYVALEAGVPETTERPLLNHLALLVGSLNDTLREAAERELVVDRVVDAPNTMAAFLAGPDGIVVEYVEHKPGFALV